MKKQIEDIIQGLVGIRILSSSAESMACSKRRATTVPNSNEIDFSIFNKHGSSTPFEAIKRGTADLGSARQLSTAGLAVPHGRTCRAARQ